MTGPCRAWADEYPAAHTCDDPVSCALASLDRDPRDEELECLNLLLDRIEDTCEGSRARLGQTVLTMIHDERGGPR